VIPLEAAALVVLKTLKRRTNGPYVFHRDGVRVASIREAFERACKRAGLVDFVFHDLRHTAVTRWVKAGLNENAIMMMSGHKTRRVFDRYVNLRPHDVKVMLEGLISHVL
jgi:integrase